MQEMRRELLKNSDWNVVVVDWAGGSLPLYTQATANTRLVGLEVAYFVNYLQEHMGLDNTIDQRLSRPLESVGRWWIRRFVKDPELRATLNASLRERRLADAPDIVPGLPDNAGPAASAAVSRSRNIARFASPVRLSW